MFGMHPRPGAGGFDKGRTWRWQPLLEARTAEGAWRRNPASLLVHADGAYKGGVWASFAIDDPAWYETDAAMTCIEGVARAMRRGVFLVDAGTNYYTYFDEQTPVAGVRAVNLGAAPVSGLSARVTFSDLESKQPIQEVSESVAAGLQTVQSMQKSVPLRNWPASGIGVTSELRDRDGTVIDRAAHEAHVWRPKPRPSFVTIRDGDFVLDGKRWRPHGVNYMPSSGIGIEDGAFFEFWIGAASYDPRIVQRDLDRLKEMGINAVSIFIYRESMESQNLLDLLRRLDALDMKANLSLRPGTPLDFQWDAMREPIEYYRLAQNDTVFAYDLAWEPMFGNQAERRPYDAQWRAWIDERYGGVESAERDWAYAAPRDEAGAVTGPPGEQFAEDGPLRVMVAAYRRFLDTLLYEKYSQAPRLARSIDPNHAVSFRMT